MKAKLVKESLVESKRKFADYFREYFGSVTPNFGNWTLSQDVRDQADNRFKDDVDPRFDWLKSFASRNGNFGTWNEYADEDNQSADEFRDFAFDFLEPQLDLVEVADGVKYDSMAKIGHYRADDYTGHSTWFFKL